MLIGVSGDRNRRVLPKGVKAWRMDGHEITQNAEGEERTMPPFCLSGPAAVCALVMLPFCTFAACGLMAVSCAFLVLSGIMWLPPARHWRSRENRSNK